MQEPTESKESVEFPEASLPDNYDEPDLGARN